MMIPFTTYNTQNDINNVITTLHDSVGKGRQAFPEAVSKVDQKIKKVMDPINRLQNEIQRHKGKLECNVKSLFQALEAFKVNAENDDLKEVYGLAVFNLKSTQFCELETSVFDGLQKSFDTVSGALANLKNRESQVLVEDEKGRLKKEVEQLSKRLSELEEVGDTVKVPNKTLSDYEQMGEDDNVWDLRSPIKSLKQELNEKFKKYVTEYVKKVQTEVQSIKEDMKNVNLKGSVPGGKISKLHRQAKSVKDDIFKLDGQLQLAAGKIGKTIHDSVEQVGTALTTLDTKVKFDLEKLEGQVKGLFGDLKRSSQGFCDKFSATKGALFQAITVVESAITKLGTLDQLESIDTSKLRDLKLLTALKKGGVDPFDSLKQYFQKLDIQVMQPVKEAMEKINELVKIYAGYYGVNRLPDELKKSPVNESITTALKSLTTISNLTTLPNLTNVKSLLGNIVFDDLNTEFSNVLPVINNLKTKSVENISKDELESLLPKLAEMAKAVATHSHSVVRAVIDGVRTEVQTEIHSVAQAINSKVNKIKQGVNNGSAGDIKVEYGGGGETENVRGLEWLVTDFTSSINTVIQGLDKQVEGAFKKGSGSNEYNIQEAMPQYYNWVKEDGTQKETLKAKIAAIKTDLKDYFRAGDVNRLSSFKLDKDGPFKEYYSRRQVATEVIGRVLEKIGILEGTYPTVEALDTYLEMPWMTRVTTFQERYRPLRKGDPSRRQNRCPS
ncbi:hypothetical protein BOVATA_049370 [Babesia ovata]|uniref:Uncharacterized protein n=1 Tax=Babesia ovata TaxID=189622 RepID=A0A2H6KKC0_9APIC|nr:uncharacterized protein BOVATA_049370 [Babesia ovata]GBE63444.1 hypothetical protein BOVATA_049370 [Babesia ovata]